MPTYIIHGGQPLMGELILPGSLASVCTTISASLIYPTVNIFHNCPNIHHLKSYISSLEDCNIDIEISDNIISIDSRNININALSIPSFQYPGIPELVAALVSRFKKLKFYTESAYDLGYNSFRQILDVFNRLGIQVEENHGVVSCDASKCTGKSIYADIHTSLFSRNIMIAATLLEGDTILENAFCNSSVIHIQALLNKMGAQVSMEQAHTIKVTGASVLHGTEFIVPPSISEVCAYLSAAAITGGSLTLINIPYNMTANLAVLERCGCKFLLENNSITITAPQPLQALGDFRIKDSEADSLSIIPYLLPLLSLAKGISILADDGSLTVSRIVRELIKLGAQVEYRDKSAIFKGSGILHGTELQTTSPYVAKILSIAALAAEGQTILQFSGSLSQKNSFDSFISNIKLLGGNIEVLNTNTKAD